MVQERKEGMHGDCPNPFMPVLAEIMRVHFCGLESKNKVVLEIIFPLDKSL